MKRVLIVAGESSGDLHGSALMAAMKKKSDVELEFSGFGGDRMIEEGLKSIRHVQEMNIMGFVEVIRHLPFIRRAMNDLESLLDSWRPDMVILIDYPGFNLKFAPFVKKRAIPLMYYISPQLWAWHKSRVKLIRQYVDRMVVIFDFERKFYSEYGIDADFVGHPLIDSVAPMLDRQSFRNSVGVTDDTPLIGLIPGSRKQEIDKMLPSMIESIALLRKKNKTIVAVLACAPDIDDALYDEHLSGQDIIPLRGKTHDIMAHSDALAVTSGTATLEAGILGTPMVIVYKTSFLTYVIGKSLVKLPDIGLINIIAGARIVPELWQYNVNAENIAAHLDIFIKDSELRRTISESLKLAKSKLGDPGAADRTAKVALEILFPNTNN